MRDDCMPCMSASTDASRLSCSSQRGGGVAMRMLADVER
ncbi:hypothetical protein BURMUCGD1_5825 [Burkholderia multivorans CGD1]|nr:hypothetical protein BURMUCGD1_5825 [Burkholderia multivorans CGD1]